MDAEKVRGCAAANRSVGGSLATASADMLEAFASLLEREATPVHPTAAYMCGTCGAQWFDGIQQDCGHHKNERAYCKPSPCTAVLKPASSTSAERTENE